MNPDLTLWERLCTTLVPFVTAQNAHVAQMWAQILVLVACLTGATALVLWVRRKFRSAKPKTPKSRSDAGFTLIELLVVIVIIAILAALTINVAGFVQGKGARARAEAEVAALTSALESYKADNGDYPEADIAASTASTKAELDKFLVVIWPADKEKKVYYEFNKNQIQVSGEKTNFIDPFGTQYGYKYPGSANRSGSNFFDLWSMAGKKPTDPEDQWVKNW